MKPAKNKTNNTVLSPGALKDLEAGDTVMFDDIEQLDIVEADNYRNLDPVHVEVLKGSIKESGVLEPVSLRLDLAEDGTVRLSCVSGHHRMAAVKDLRLEAQKLDEPWLYRLLPCVVTVKRAGEQAVKTSIRAIVSNSVIRKEGVLDRAAAIKKMSLDGLTKQKIGAILGLERKTVERAVAVSELPPEVTEFFALHQARFKDNHIYAAAAKNRALAKEPKDARVKAVIGDLEAVLNPAPAQVSKMGGKAKISRDPADATSGSRSKTVKKTTGKPFDLEDVLAVVKKHVDSATYEKISHELS